MADYLAKSLFPAGLSGVVMQEVAWREEVVKMVVVEMHQVGQHY